MYNLIKLANDTQQESSESNLGTIAGGGLGLAASSPVAFPRASGMQRFYHGTATENVEPIKQEGLLASKGGKNGATFPESGNMDESVGKVHLSHYKQVGNYHANFHDLPKDELFALNSTAEGQNKLFEAPVNGKGSVLSGYLPFQKYDKLEIDPVFNQNIINDLPENVIERPFAQKVLRDFASRGEMDVLPIELDGAGHSMKERLRYYGSHLPEYVKNYPGRFAGGLATAGAGIAGGSYLGHRLEEWE